MNKLHDALKNEELMLEVGRKATEEQKAMTQSTVEEQFKERFEIFIQDYDYPFSEYVCCNGGIKGDVDCACNGLLWKDKIEDFIKSELQLAEQKVREELKQTIIEKIEEYAKSQTDQHTKYAIMGCISLINEI